MAPAAAQANRRQSDGQGTQAGAQRQADVNRARTRAHHRRPRRRDPRPIPNGAPAPHRGGAVMAVHSGLRRRGVAAGGAPPLRDPRHAPEETFDRITRLVRSALQVPMSVVSFVERDRQWSKSRQGVAAAQRARSIAFCNHTIRSTAPLIVPDALADPRFAASPLVLGEPHVRFYAGVPLRSHDGHNLGALCAMDTRPRSLDAGQIEMPRRPRPARRRRDGAAPGRERRQSDRGDDAPRLRRCRAARRRPRAALRPQSELPDDRHRPLQGGQRHARPRGRRSRPPGASPPPAGSSCAPATISAASAARSSP